MQHQTCSFSNSLLPSFLSPLLFPPSLPFPLSPSSIEDIIERYRNEVILDGLTLGVPVPKVLTAHVHVTTPWVTVNLSSHVSAYLFLLLFPLPSFPSLPSLPSLPPSLSLTFHFFLHHIPPLSPTLFSLTYIPFPSPHLSLPSPSSLLPPLPLLSLRSQYPSALPTKP